MTEIIDSRLSQARQLKSGVARPVEPGMSRRGFLRNISLAAAAGAIPVVAAGEVLAAISSSPSLVAGLMTTFLGATKRFGAAAKAEDLIENDVAAAVMADKTTYQVSWPSSGVSIERRHFHPWYREADNWRDEVTKTAAQRHRSVGRNWFGNPDVLHARVDEDTRRAISQGDDAEAAYAVLTASMGLDAAQQHRETLSNEFDHARAALIGYRPRNLDEVGEKSAALLELDDIGDDELATILATFIMTTEA